MYPTHTTSVTGTFRVPAVSAPAPAAAAAPAPVWGAAPPREAVQPPAAPPPLSGETSTGWATGPAVLLAAGPEVPAARAQTEPEPLHAGPDIPHPQAEATHAGPATLRLRIADPVPPTTVPPATVPAPAHAKAEFAPTPVRPPAQAEPNAPAAPAPTAAAARATTAWQATAAPEPAPRPVGTPAPAQWQTTAAPEPAPRPARTPPAAATVPAPTAAPVCPAAPSEPDPAPGPDSRSAHPVAPESDPLPAPAPAPAAIVPAPARPGGSAEAGAAGESRPELRRPAPSPAQPQPEPQSQPEPLPEPEPEPRSEAEAEAEAEAETEAATEAEAEACAGRAGVPGPGVVEIVAQAVARGLAEEAADARDLPVPHTAPLRGSAVTEVPVHLPFRGERRTFPPAPAATAARAPRQAAAPRPAPGRRVPRGDDRLREHRGPVLPGWIGVGIGGLALAGCAAVLWRAGAVPDAVVAAFGAAPRAYQGLRATHWPPLAFLGIVALLALGGLGRSRAGHAWVLTLFGRYRGTVRRTGLTWISPLLLRRRVDVRLRHWRSEPMPAVDSGGLALQVVVQVVWQVKDTARAALAVEDHVEYLAEQVESAMARVLSQLPADAFHEDAPTLRDAEAVGDALTRMLAAETEAVGIDVFSAQPTRIEYAPEVAEAMRRRRVAAIDAKHRDAVLSSVVDAVDDTVHRLTSRGLVELDDYERKALVKDLTVAFYTGRCE
ncbi:SPFH domain-containing protein [Streptomyces sp. IBSNAI002]|uniref:SPFH domain-containing protein n=1 Tax=Streptomyces sp. IBSNAI002 TaxID=3457500 RepID=UPI003FD60DE2